ITSRALISLGVQVGDRVAILGETSYEWMLADVGNVLCGGVTVGIYPSNLPEDCRYILEHSDADLLFVDGSEQLDKIREVRGQLPRIRCIVTFEGESIPEEQILSFDDFLALAEEVTEETLQERWGQLTPDSLATIVYTSGTTGVPKGVMITHDNLLFTTWSVSQRLSLAGKNYTTLLFLPLAHVYGRLVVWWCLRDGTEVAFCDNLARLPEALREVRPHWVPCVPRVYEKIYDRITATADACGGIRKTLFYWAMAVGHQRSRLEQAGQPIPLGLRLKNAVAHRIAFKKIQDVFGGQMVFGVSGAAPLNQTLAEFFHAAGVLILEGIGMTENSSFSNVNTKVDNRFGTVGLAGPGIEISIASDGEVLFRGRNVMKGYFKNDEATAESIDADGWLHSGDIGEIDDGYLTITDRKKDLIVTAGGKNIAPQRIERILRTSPFVSHAVAYGDRRKFIVALITLEHSAVESWAKDHGHDGETVETLSNHPDLRRRVEEEIQRLNEQLASFETVKRIHLIADDLSIENGELTPTMKVKRKVVFERYGDALAALYDNGPAPD
ncbi:MAG: long-chain fatty acid--CoA ligase, partial [Acidobacteriota bacterium]|nr:long-chain fatty acid--CoA ligase [Acidobacteriota bacterium]